MADTPWYLIAPSPGHPGGGSYRGPSVRNYLRNQGLGAQNLSAVTRVVPFVWALAAGHGRHALVYDRHVAQATGRQPPPAVLHARQLLQG